MVSYVVTHVTLSKKLDFSGRVLKLSKEEGSVTK